MLGVWVNAAGVALGGLIGSRLRGGIPEKYKNTIMHGLALCVMLIGISGAVKTSDVMGVIVSMVLGSALGEALRIEERLDQLGSWAQNRFAKNDANFAQGFVTTTLLFCVGAMAVVGSLEAGLSNKPDTLLAKSALDTVSAVIFASTLGLGVVLTAVPLLVYQGGIALLAGFVAPLLSDAMVNELSAVGSLLIVALSLNMLGATKEHIRVANMLPAMVVIVIYRLATAFAAGLL